MGRVVVPDLTSSQAYDAIFSNLNTVQSMGRVVVPDLTSSQAYDAIFSNLNHCPVNGQSGSAGPNF